jgi:hypothetical protein
MWKKEEAWRRKERKLKALTAALTVAGWLGWQMSRI